MLDELIARRHRQLLVHCFIYYKLGESVIADSTFDAWRRQLADLHRRHPALAKQAPYYDLCKEFKDSPSGFFIKEYPPEIQSVGLRLVYYHQRPDMDFLAFCARMGYKLV